MPEAGKADGGSWADPMDNALGKRGLEADFSTLIKYIHVLNKRLL